MNPIFIFCLVAAGLLISGVIVDDAIEHHNHMVYMDGYLDAIQDVRKAMEEEKKKENIRFTAKTIKYSGESIGVDTTASAPRHSERYPWGSGENH